MKTAPVLLEDRLEESITHIRAQVRHRPQIALILGSGLGQFAEQLTAKRVIPSCEIPFYPRSTVPGHAGRLVFGRITSGKSVSPPLLVFQGRIHYYETRDLEDVIYPVLVARRLGAATLLVTNAAGGLHSRLHAGDLMLLRDFFSLSFLPLPAPPSKLVVAETPTHKRRPSRIAPRIPVRQAFDPVLSELVLRKARQIGIRMAEGTYCWLQGPTYETAAEIAMLRKIGADAVGMSTVPEVATAARMGMRVAGISLISNMATGLNPQKLTHDEVTSAADQAKPIFTRLLREILVSLR